MPFKVLPSVIQHCYQCPHSELFGDNGRCTHIYGRVDKISARGIPYWCPLDDAEEKEKE